MAMSQKFGEIVTVCSRCVLKRHIFEGARVAPCRFVSLWGSGKSTSKSKATSWNQAVSEAERIVGYPTSFMSLRCLLSDELSNVAMQMRKLMGTKHPLLKTARRFIYDGNHSTQTRGLLVLLISKTAGPGPQQPESEVIESMVAGIYPRQRQLAEITEMIHTAYLVHKGTVNLANLQMEDNGNSVGNMEFGNKMSVLSGDFLLASASQGLAELYNTEVVEMISSALGDLMAAEFTGFTDKHGNSIMPSGGATIQDWELQTYLGSGCLLAKSCHSAMILAGHGEVVQKRAYDFGKFTALAYQLQEDIQQFTKPLDDISTLSLTSAPLLLHLDESKYSSQLQELLGVPELDRSKIYETVCEGPGIQKAQDLCREYGGKALLALRAFKISEARTALENIIQAITR